MTFLFIKVKPMSVDILIMNGLVYFCTMYIKIKRHCTLRAYTSVDQFEV